MTAPALPGYYWFKRRGWGTVTYDWEIVELQHSDRSWILYSLGDEQIESGLLAEAPEKLGSLGAWGPCIPPYTGGADVSV